MWNARLDEAQAEIKIARRNISNLRYADDTTIMAESKELKCLLMKMKEESKKLAKMKMMASGPITSWQTDREIMETVQFSCSVVSDSLWAHGLKHPRPPCPLPTPRVYPKWCPLIWWCHPTISSSVVPFSLHLQSFLAPGTFQMSQFFASHGQSIGLSASASVLPMHIQNSFPLVLTGGSPCSPRNSQESSPTPRFKSINYSVLSFLHSPTLTSIHNYWKSHTLG